MNGVNHKMNLNLDWTFLLGEEKNAWYKGYDDSHWRKIQIPHDWSVEAPFSKEHSSGTGYLPGGIGWYRKNLILPHSIKNKKVILTIEGAYNNSKVWFNSHYLGNRPYGYSTIKYDISDFVIPGENSLSIRINRDSTSDSRWFTGSGLYRNVYLTIKENIHFVENGIFYQTVECDEKHAEMNIQSMVSNETDEPCKLKVIHELVDDKGESIGTNNSEILLNGNEISDVEQTILLTDPLLWNPDSPHLYTLVSSIYRDNSLLDKKETRVGIRSIRFDSKKGFFLNNNETIFKGVCIHHDAGTLGAAVPKKVWRRRLKKFKELGANAIRMSHNPPSPDLLDLCDEIGFLVIDEAFDEWEGPKNKWSSGHNVYPPKHDGYYEHFPQWAETDLKDLILRDRNHPSIVMWSIGNEIDYPNDPYCHPYFQEMTGNNDKNKPKAERVYDPNKPNAERLVTISKSLVKYVKEIDQSRPVTAALAFPELSNITGLSHTLDVVGYNYKEHLYEEDHGTNPNFFIYGSENGHDLNNWLVVVNNEYISGQFLWTGIDFLGEAQGWPIRGSRAGLLDIAGFEKPGFYFRKSLWAKDLFCKIVTAKENTGEEMHWDYKIGEKITIRAYTNGKEAECFLDGESLGSKQVKNIGDVISWETPFKQGEIKIVAVDGSGKEAVDVLETPSKKNTRLKAICEKNVLLANGEDISFIEISASDEKGRRVISEDIVEVSVDGPIEILGIENGDLSDLTPYFDNRRKMYKSKLLVYLRSKREVGEAFIRLRSQSLESAEVKISIQNKLY